MRIFKPDFFVNLFVHNFAPRNAPEGSASLYVEVARPPGFPGGCRSLWEDVRQGLERVELLERGEKPAVLDVIQIPYAYVLYDHYRGKVLPGILKGLEERGVFSIGRYGAWEYSTMEDALYQGRRLARRLRRG